MVTGTLPGRVVHVVAVAAGNRGMVAVAGHGDRSPVAGAWWPEPTAVCLLCIDTVKQPP